MTVIKTFGLKAGSWTDDTSIALCLAESLLENDGEADGVDQVQKYLKWWRKDTYLSMTNVSISASTLRKYFLSGRKQLANLSYDQLLVGSEKRRKAAVGAQNAVTASFSTSSKVDGNGDVYHKPLGGNGSLMRTISVALIPKDDRVLSLARECSQTTDPHPVNSEYCQIYVDCVRMALTGATFEDLAEKIVKYSVNPDICLEVQAVLEHYKIVNDWKKRPTNEIKSWGYVVFGLEIAFWALFSIASFEEDAVNVINLGYDTDTNGAIYGGLAGAYYGYDAIPERWLEKMQKMNVIENMVEKIIAFRMGSSGPEASPKKT